MENKLVTQFEIWDIKVPDYVKVRINNGEKPLIDFCNGIIKKFEELAAKPMLQEIENVKRFESILEKFGCKDNDTSKVNPERAEFERKLKLIFENSRYGAYSNPKVKEVLNG